MNQASSHRIKHFAYKQLAIQINIWWIRTITPQHKLLIFQTNMQLFIMKLSFLSFSLLLFLSSAIPSEFSIVGYTQEDLTSHDSLIDLFQSWMAKHNKSYDTIKEMLRRFEVFKDNLKHIDETNKKRTSYWLGLNEFADLGHEEFKMMHLGLKLDITRQEATSSDTSEFMYENAVELPKSVDWRKKGAITPVKNQGACGKNPKHVERALAALETL